MRSTSSAKAGSARLNSRTSSVALTREDTLLREGGHQNAADLIGDAVGRAQVDAARDAGPDQPAAAAVDRKDIGLIIGTLLGLDVARTIDGVPIAEVAPTPAKADLRIARHPVVALARADEMRCHDAIEAVAAGRGRKLIGARCPARKYHPGGRSLNALMQQRRHHAIFPKPTASLILLYPDDQHFMQRRTVEGRVLPAIDQGGADAGGQGDYHPQQQRQPAEP